MGEGHKLLGEADGINLPAGVQPRLCLDAGSVYGVPHQVRSEPALGGSGAAMISSSRWNDMRIEAASWRIRKSVRGSYFAIAKFFRLAVVVRARCGWSSVPRRVGGVSTIPPPARADALAMWQKPSRSI